MIMEIKVGQVWRKLGPYGWWKIERIVAPGYPRYDGGLPGVSITAYPPQLNGIWLRGGKQYFISDGPDHTWQEQIQHNRYLLKEG